MVGTNGAHISFNQMFRLKIKLYLKKLNYILAMLLLHLKKIVVMYLISHSTHKRLITGECRRYPVISSRINKKQPPHNTFLTTL